MEVIFTNEPMQFREEAKRQMEHIATLVNLTELSLPEPVFPEGTEFSEYEDIPLASIPTPDGGLVFLAFDDLMPRPFPCGSFIKNGDFLIEEEFRVLRRKWIAINSEKK